MIIKPMSHYLGWPTSMIFKENNITDPNSFSNKQLNNSDWQNWYLPLNLSVSLSLTKRILLMEFWWQKGKLLLLTVDNSRQIITRINPVNKNGTRMVKVDEDNIKLRLPTFLNMTPLSQQTQWLSRFLARNSKPWSPSPLLLKASCMYVCVII